MMAVEITLTPWEFKFCAEVASARMATSNDAGWNHASTYRRDHLQRMTEEIVGACGEMAAAKALNVFWSPSVNTFHRSSDLPGGIEVRSTTEIANSLIVRDNDRDDWAYILVVGNPPIMTVVGWLFGYEAKSEKFLRNPHNNRPAWFVPQPELTPINRGAENPQVLFSPPAASVLQSSPS